MVTQTKEKICTTPTPHWSLKRPYNIVFGMDPSSCVTKGTASPFLHMHMYTRQIVELKLNLNLLHAHLNCC
jgi:hypothetical protein